MKSRTEELKEEFPVGTKVRVYCRHLKTHRKGKILSNPIAGHGLVLFFKVSGVSGLVNSSDIIKQ